MKFRLISKYGEGLPLLQIISDEGFKVDVWLKEGKTDLPKAQAWNTSLAQDTIILFDYCGSGKIADTLMKSGFAVYGAGTLNDTIEYGAFGTQMAKLAGMRIPEEKRFNTYNEALEDGWQLQPQRPGENFFTVREHIEGPEISIEKYYSRGMPVPKTLNSKLETGDAAAVRIWKKNTPKLYNRTLRKVEPFLMRFRYSGPLSCKVIIGDDIYFVKWLTRFNPKGMAAFKEALNKKLGQFIVDMFKGSQVIKPKYDWYCSNGTAKCPDKETQAYILNDVMDVMKKLQKWRYL